MRPAVTAFALGVVVFGALALGVAIVAAALAEGAGRSSYSLAVAGVELVTSEWTARGASTTFGPGLAVVALLGGIANAAAAVGVGRLRRRSVR